LDRYKYIQVKWTAIFLWLVTSIAVGQINKTDVSFKDYIRSNIPSKAEIDVFLNDASWAQYDSDVGYILGNYMPHDGMDSSSTISTAQPNGARTAFMYKDKHCRINTYGNSFTLCHQVSDGETWQEYLAGHLGEPVRNFGMGGFGVYQAYKRMVREESTAHDAEYVILYIWGDDHIRSLLRCRYMLTTEWNQRQNSKEGIGKMFHGNFWSNIEMDLKAGQLVENENLLSTPHSLYKMTDPIWMVDNLKDDLALQMALYAREKIKDIDTQKIKDLSNLLNFDLDIQHHEITRKSISKLLDKYSFAATKYILNKTKEFTENNNKKLMIIIFNPSRVTKELIKKKTRYDEEIVNYLKINDFNYFDMNLVHVEDYKIFNLNLEDYFKRYFIGHYNPTGNHFFAYSIKNRIVEWLAPKPITYKKNK
jgi:hypothetical protein